jgi:hypothetical protein
MFKYRKKKLMSYPGMVVDICNASTSVAEIRVLWVLDQSGWHSMTCLQRNRHNKPEQNSKCPILRDIRFDEAGRILSYLGERLSFLFYSTVQLIEWETPTLWRTICLTYFVYSNVNFIQKGTHKTDKHNVWSNSCVPLKITPKINHHNQ